MDKEKRIRKVVLEFKRFQVKLAKFFICVAIIDILVLAVSVIFWYQDGIIWSTLGLLVCAWFIFGGAEAVAGINNADEVFRSNKEEKDKEED